MHNNPDLNVPYDDLNNAIIQELHLLGLKNGLFPKRAIRGNQSSKSVTTQGFVFRKPLQHLPSKRVQRPSGIEAEIPSFISDVCSYIVQNAGIEGIFRKGGSAARQKEIRALLDQGHKVSLADHHVIDIANILKYFLRELPEPVLPFRYHDLLLQCLLLEDTVEAILLVCLLLPRLNMNILAYLMEFFHMISEQSEANKMTHRNLAIVITPSLMPISEKISVCQNPQRVDAHVRVVEVLISNSERIGVLSDGVMGKLSLTPSCNLSAISDDMSNGIAISSRKKRRRSGSLTRMFNGLKKIVGGKASPGVEIDHLGIEEESALVPSTTEISTPCVKSAQKRKAVDASAAFSSKKKRDVLKSLPQSIALSDTPFKKTSSAFVSESDNRNQVCPYPNPPTGSKNKPKSPQKNKKHRFFVTRTYSETDDNVFSSNSKKGVSGVSNFVIKKQKQRLRHSASGNFLERSWSAVSSSNWGRRKQRPSDQSHFSAYSSSTAYMPVECDSSSDGDGGIDLSQEEPLDFSPSVFVDTNTNDFVQVPKSEYEELKSRMSAIESCISQEFSSVSNSESKASPGNLNAANTALAVQTVYEKTLEDADVAKDSSADQLAKRLSRELKIRRSSDSKVIRSPSARKIGSIRRRSREKQSPSLRRELRRNKSWHMISQSGNTPVGTPLSSSDAPLAPYSRLRRGRPNTVFSGLPHPTPNLALKETKPDMKVPILGSDESPLSTGTVTRGQARRASSFHGSEVSSPAFSSSKKSRSQVNIAKAALLAHAQQRSKGQVEQDGVWYDAQELLSSSKDLLCVVPTTGRESIAKLRCENAGKVLATAKLFNKTQDCSKQLGLRPPSLRSSLGSNQETAETKHEQPPVSVDCQVVKTSSVSQSKSNVNISCSQASGSHTSTRSTCTLKKSNVVQSPTLLTHSRKIKEKSSPSQSPKVRNVSSKVKKHSSMKVDRAIHSQPVKRNLSVPIQLVDSGKENHVAESLSVSPFSRRSSPKVGKESTPHTDRYQRISVSPLKDSNRISVQFATPQVIKYPQGVSCNTPSIKQPLTVHTPSRRAFTPQSARKCSGITPLKVLATSSITPIQSPRQRPSRLKHNTKASVKPSRSRD